MFICCFFLANTKRLEYAKSVCTAQLTLPYIIRRKNIFCDVLDLFENEKALKEFPIQINFKDEIGFDAGGVCRDMFSGFWEESYVKFFDGSS